MPILFSALPFRTPNMELNHTPPDIVSDLEAFISIGQPEMLTPFGRMPKKEVLTLAMKLIKEEVNDELLFNILRLRDKAYSFELMAQIMDDIVDSIYVLTWTAVVLDLPIKAHWHEVQKANMAKFPNGVAIRNEFGKIQKPVDWTPPDHWAVLFNHVKKIAESKTFLAETNTRPVEYYDEPQSLEEKLRKKHPRTTESGSEGSTETETPVGPSKT